MNSYSTLPSPGDIASDVPSLPCTLSALIVALGKVNVDEENQLASQFSIRAIPTVIIFKDGVEIERMSGMNSQSAYSDKINYYLN